MVMVGRYTDYLRRCRSSFIQRILDELLFEILLRLPAQDIYFGARLVCRKWYHMMRYRNFICRHLERASSGLLYMDDSDNFIFISTTEYGGLDTYKLNFMMTDPDADRELEKKLISKYKALLMILFDDASGILPTINQSPWNGLTLADFVMPVFLFMVGVSLGLVHKTMPCGAAATRKAICRAVKPRVLGLFLQAIYMVKCGVRGDTGPACNAAGMIDCMILGVNHLYRKPIYARTQYQLTRIWPTSPNAPSWCHAPFNPEGCLRSDPQAFMAMRLVNSRGRSSSLYLVTESMIIFAFQIVLQVIPEAICTRYRLAVGANFVWLMRILMLISYPISYPTETILDCVLGHNEEFGYDPGFSLALRTSHSEVHRPDWSDRIVLSSFCLRDS
ncbi:hypothetical protein OROHE_022167 [Orobanche hederae]